MFAFLNYVYLYFFYSILVRSDENKDYQSEIFVVVSLN